MNRKGPPQPYLCFFPFPMRQEDLATSLSSGEGNKNMRSSLSLSLSAPTCKQHLLFLLQTS